MELFWCLDGVMYWRIDGLGGLIGSIDCKDSLIRWLDVISVNDSSLGGIGLLFGLINGGGE